MPRFSDCLLSAFGIIFVKPFSSATKPFHLYEYRLLISWLTWRITCAFQGVSSIFLCFRVGDLFMHGLCFNFVSFFFQVHRRHLTVAPEGFFDIDRVLSCCMLYLGAILFVISSSLLVLSYFHIYPDCILPGSCFLS